MFITALLVLAAIEFSTVTAIIGTVVVIITFIAGSLVVRPYLKGTIYKSELLHKDEIIKSYQQAVASMEARLSTMQGEISDMKKLVAESQVHIVQLEKELAKSEASRRELEKYTAPAIEKMLTGLGGSIGIIDSRLDEIQRYIHRAGFNE